MNTFRDVIKKYPKVEGIARRLMATIPLSSRLGKEFWEWYAFYEESEYWSAEELLAFQIDCLQMLLSQLRKSSEFYSDRLSGIDIENIKTAQEFRTLVPTLSRADFRDHYLALRSHNWDKQELTNSRTSGTTGMALQFFHHAKDDQREWAAICHQWKRVGYLPEKSRRVEFRALTTPGKIVDIFPDKNMIRCSILDLKPEHIRYYAGQIRENKMTFYHGYPSALYLLAVQICNAGIDFPRPEAILLASENVYDWQLDRIREAFPTSKIYAHYGCAERTVLAGWCEYRQVYHTLPQYALVEVDDTTSEVIGTNLFNNINGFVRYRMTDTVLEFAEDTCPDCGRAYTPRLLQLGGRTEEYLYSLQNGWISPAIVTYPLKTLMAIQEIQFVQKEMDALTIKFTIRPQFALLLDDDLKQIEADVLRLFGLGMKFKFERVEDFERSPSGKFKWIICELDELPWG
jgi:phenylacetate-coenzyme A ligase PaaK-like adenylate-forming protein